MVSDTYGSSTIDSNIKVLNSEEHFSDLTNARYEEDVSVLIESVGNKEPFNFSPGLKSEVNDACSCFDASIFDHFVGI